MRTTPKMIRAQVADLAGRGFDVAVNWAYGMPRLTTKDESRDISPRLPCGKFQLWFDGFRTALDEAQRLKSEPGLRLAKRDLQAILDHGEWSPQRVNSEIRSVLEERL